MRGDRLPTPACPPPPATVIELWNRVAEDTGSLEHALLTFAELLFAAAILQ